MVLYCVMLAISSSKPTMLIAIPCELDVSQKSPASDPACHTVQKSSVLIVVSVKIFVQFDAGVNTPPAVTAVTTARYDVAPAGGVIVADPAPVLPPCAVPTTFNTPATGSE